MGLFSSGILFHLASEVVPVLIVVDPSIVDLVEHPRRCAAQHSEPISIVHKKIRLATRTLIMARLEPVHRPEMPSSDPRSRPVTVQSYAGGDHSSQIHGRPVVCVEDDQIRLLVGVEISDVMPVMRSHLPPRRVSVITVSH